MAVLRWRTCHVRLGVNLISWSNFCVLVWLPLSWRDFITLSDIVRICGHVMDDVITLWSRESWYDFSPSWLKFSSWCDFVCLGVILHLGAINLILIFSSPWLFFGLVAILFDLVLFHILVRSTAYWYDFFSSWYDLSDLVSFRILVRITKSWYDLCVLGGDIFLYISLYSCMYIFIFTHVFKTSCTQIKFLVYCKEVLD